MIDNFKLFENTQLARSILRKFGVGENSKTYNDIKELTKDHNGYLGFFVKMWLEQGVSFESLKEKLKQNHYELFKMGRVTR
jgi:hypothetical protein